jgi:hypothetical protein
MSTRREQILQAITDLLAPGTGEPPVFRSRTAAIERGQSPAIIVEPVRDDGQQSTIPRLTWTLLVRISVVVRGEPADQVADQYIEAIHQKIMTDTTLDGLSIDIEPASVNFELLEADGGGGVIPLDYRVIYQTSREDISTI